MNTNKDKLKTKKKKGNRVVRGVKNFLAEERAAAREDYSTLRKLKKNPKY